MKALKMFLDWCDDKTQTILVLTFMFTVVFFQSDLGVDTKEKLGSIIISGILGLVTGYSIAKMNGNGKTGDSEKPPVDVEPSPPIG